MTAVHGRARTVHSPWTDAQFELVDGALVVHRPDHVQPRVRIELSRIRRLDELAADDTSVDVELVTTVGSVLQCTWPEGFCAQVVEALRSTLDRPPSPIPAPTGTVDAGDGQLWVPSVLAPAGRSTRRRATRRRPRRGVASSVLALAVVIALLGVDLVAIHLRIDRVEADLPDAPDGVRTWLLVGSDSRAAAEGFDRIQSFGSVDEVPGERADVVLIVQEGVGDAPPRVVSVPRDLLVFRREKGVDRLALTLLDGPRGVVLSVCRSLGIAADHVVTIRFDGLADLVDLAGGIEVHRDAATRDLNTGLDLPPGVSRLRGADAIAWMRSRHLEHLVEGVWEADPASDTGRQQHQRDVLDQLSSRLASRARNPVLAQRLAWTASGALTTDGATGPLDLGRLALTLRAADAGESMPHSLDDGQIPVATLTSDAEPVIDLLRNGRADGPPCPRPSIS